MHTKLLITRREAGLMLAGAAMAAAVPARAEEPANTTRFAAAPSTAALRPGHAGKTEIWSLTSPSEGPFLSATVGLECVIDVHNGIGLPLSLHWHGARIDNAMDGVGGLTQEPIPPGGSFTYRFTPRESGTWLIRPCVFGGTSELAGRGLNSLLIVDGPQRSIARSGFNLIVDDWLLAENGQLMPFAKTTRGRLGNLLTVNNRPAPFDLETELGPSSSLARKLDGELGGRYLVRLANACNARSFRIRFDRMKAYVVAVDGQPTEAFEPLRSSLPFSPGNRYDVLIELPESGPDSAITALLGREMPLATFKPRPRGTALPPEIAPPEHNPLLPQKIRLQDALRFDISLDAIFGKPAPGTALNERMPVAWAFNGLPDDARKAKPLFSVKSGRPVVLALNNTSTVPQPIHVHGHCFRLLHPFDDGWDPFWMDTLLIPAQTTVRIAFIAGLPGKWLVESTIAEHFDTGLWGWFEVV